MRRGVYRMHVPSLRAPRVSSLEQGVCVVVGDFSENEEAICQGLDGEPALSGNECYGLSGVDKDVRRVFAVVPVGKICGLVVQVRHDEELAVWVEELQQLFDLLRRLLEVLEHFAAKDIVIAAIQVIVVREKVGIEQLYPIPSVGQLLGDDRPCPAAVV